MLGGIFERSKAEMPVKADGSFVFCLHNQRIRADFCFTDTFECISQK
ncbi:Uncharacterised protein [Neisseria gonorrhoeae]|uniref:Uncharacterized protein n=1 Tax=Neisseria gonorrhoeae TaxID=485 RepID=A0A378VXH8_NEIGO|nr:Uncharacterised protein [Neisseria gonorrhoeae]